MKDPLLPKKLQHNCLCLAPAAFLLLLATAAPSVFAEGHSIGVYLGSYTSNTNSKGIYLTRLDLASGMLSPATLAAEIEQPSFLALHPNRRFLYAVNESGGGSRETGEVTAFAIGDDGKLSVLNRQPSRGTGPCHLVVDRAGKNLLVANYGGGSVAAFPIASDGRLGDRSGFVQHSGSSVNPQRQKAPHAHSINMDPANQFAVAADLGLDKVLVYRFDKAKGTLTPNEPPAASVKPGSGPRHFAFHPQDRSAYVINELANTVTAFRYEASKGVLSEIQTISTLPSGFAGTSHTAEVQVHPSGKFLYGSNRGHDSIAVFAIEASGRLRYVENVATGGSTPRNFGISPDGRYLLAANQQSNNVVVFRIDANSGRLTPTGSTLEVPTPVCVKFLPSK
ncbi:MAG: lactonase family protein [Acidimicrobiia bacterium]|nr:lactonase family protein [Acidimicrobiia bacterium]